MKILKKILTEPEEWPNKDPERILIEDLKWSRFSVDSLRGQLVCLNIAFQQLKHAIWKELTK